MTPMPQPGPCPTGRAIVVGDGAGTAVGVVVARVMRRLFGGQLGMEARQMVGLVGMSKRPRPEAAVYPPNPVDAPFLHQARVVGRLPARWLASIGPVGSVGLAYRLTCPMEQIRIDGRTRLARGAGPGQRVLCVAAIAGCRPLAAWMPGTGHGGFRP